MAKNQRVTLSLLGSFIVIMASSESIASSHPLWTFLPKTPTTIVVSTSGSATIQYILTNQTKKRHTLAMKPIIGIQQITTGSHTCQNPMAMNAGESCALTLQISGTQLPGAIKGGPDVCQANPDGTASLFNCFRPSLSNNLNITLVPTEAVLSASASTTTPRALAVNGVTRAITITNTGTTTANNIRFTTSSLPEGTTVSSSCTDLQPNSTCAILVHPGPIANLDISNNPCNITGSLPIPSLVTISAANAPSVTSAFLVLNYGCIYQSGYVFSMNDSTPIIDSISGVTATLADQTAAYPDGVVWSSNGNGSTSSDVANDPIPGIYDTSTAPPEACNGLTDGACNSRQIVNYYPSVTPAYYSAGVCSQYQIDSAGHSPCQIGNTCFIDWYLPSVCEMGYSTSMCHTSEFPFVPLIQNMQTNLYDNNQIGQLYGGSYWSSTESSINAAWYSSFQYNNQYAYSKAGQLTIRCARTFS